MSSHKFVCWDCKEGVRRSIWTDTNVKCPKCGKECEWIGVKIPIPPKSKPKRWAELHDQLLKEKRDKNYNAFASEVSRKHEIEQEITKLERLPENIGRRSLIKSLKRQLDAISV